MLDLTFCMSQECRSGKHEFLVKYKCNKGEDEKKMWKKSTVGSSGDGRRGECDGSVLWPSRDLHGNESTKLKNKKAELCALSKIHQIEVEESTS